MLRNFTSVCEFIGYWIGYVCHAIYHAIPVAFFRGCMGGYEDEAYDERNAQLHKKN